MHHLGVAVDNLEEVVETYRSVFGAELEHRETMPSQGVEAVAVRVGESRVEFLRALGDDTPIGKFIANRGPGMHHVAYEVSDLRGQLNRLAEQGVELIDAEPRKGLFGLEVAFVHPHAMHGVLAELVSGA
ncbi:MAG: methylmalonyl-CoA epimerase [Actinobacteria bacterium]|nr:methylmalonyl-CoA epimerase [Actinomycetota bacterium]